MFIKSDFLFMQFIIVNKNHEHVKRCTPRPDDNHLNEFRDKHVNGFV